MHFNKAVSVFSAASLVSSAPVVEKRAGITDGKASLRN